MLYVIVHWILSALSLLVVAHLVPGFVVRGFGAALIAAVVIGLINATFGLILKILTLPLTIVTFGLFLFVVNALMLQLAAWLVPGFDILRFSSALFGAVVLSLIHLVLRVTGLR